MSAIILMNADDPYLIEVIEDPGGYGENLIFDSPQEADEWIQKNAKVGWCTRIIDLD